MPVRTIRVLSGASPSHKVELVEIDGQAGVLKTSDAKQATAEKAFQKTLKDHGIPHLKVFENKLVRPDQTFMEYVKGEETVSRNNTAALARSWGQTVADLHAVKRPYENWAEFIHFDIKNAVAHQRFSRHDLSETTLSYAENALKALESYTPPSFCLAHGDLHGNNALVRGKEVILFDNIGKFSVAPAIYDLAVVFADFPNRRYIEIDEPEYANDPELLQAFIDGYGPLLADEKTIDLFVLLRSLYRYPNKFEIYLKQIIESIAERYGS